MENHVSSYFSEKRKEWKKASSQNSWLVFKIMAEFVEGFEKMQEIGPCVSIFGSARTKPGSPYYELSTEIAAKLAKTGFGVITGGGPGIMEAGNNKSLCVFDEHHFSNKKVVEVDVFVRIYIWVQVLFERQFDVQTD